MQTFRTLLIVVVVTLTLAAGGFAAVKTYQFTGTVKSVDADTFTVEKSATETWSFSTDASTKGGRPKDRKSTSELQSPMYLVCRLLLEKKKKKKKKTTNKKKKTKKIKVNDIH